MRTNPLSRVVPLGFGLLAGRVAVIGDLVSGAADEPSRYPFLSRPVFDFFGVIMLPDDPSTRRGLHFRHFRRIRPTVDPAGRTVPRNLRTRDTRATIPTSRTTPIKHRKHKLFQTGPRFTPEAVRVYPLLGFTGRAAVWSEASRPCGLRVRWTVGNRSPSIPD